MKSNLLKKLLATFLSAGLVFTLAACNDEDTTTGGGGGTDKATTAAQNNNTGDETQTDDPTESDFDLERDIKLITRDAESGTRGALVDLADIKKEDAEGKKVDAITDEAEVAGGTAQVLTAVETNELAIGYVSLDADTKSVKVLKIGGVEATTANILAGTYKLQREFNLTRKEKLSDAAEDFWNFIFSAEGQAIIGDKLIEYPGNKDAKPFESNGASGKVTVGGSTSIQPTMDKLVEAYKAIGDAKATVEVQGGGSGPGETQVDDGTFDIGMVSRDVKSEFSHLTIRVMAIDGIAIVVNKSNPTSNIELDDIKKAYMGEMTIWAELN
ncbi:MAG: substrate-binding domain-containing protein [Oscillospiraceae bacterium]|nr:substrate-binding domain-containing protein [Oscillospiraceae bacterium]